MEEEVLWGWGAVLVTLSVIYLEFKANLASMATTAFCSGLDWFTLKQHGFHSILQWFGLVHT
jgi:hypothetical protein